jgi:hypothetical protein
MSYSGWWVRDVVGTTLAHHHKIYDRDSNTRLLTLSRTLERGARRWLADRSELYLKPPGLAGGRTKNRKSLAPNISTTPVSPCHWAKRTRPNDTSSQRRIGKVRAILPLR